MLLCVLCLNGYERKIRRLKQHTDYKERDSCPPVTGEKMRCDNAERLARCRHRIQCGSSSSVGNEQLWHWRFVLRPALTKREIVNESVRCRLRKVESDYQRRDRLIRDEDGER